MQQDHVHCCLRNSMCTKSTVRKTSHSTSCIVKQKKKKKKHRHKRHRQAFKYSLIWAQEMPPPSFFDLSRSKTWTKRVHNYSLLIGYSHCWSRQIQLLCTMEPLGRRPSHTHLTATQTVEPLGRRFPPPHTHPFQMKAQPHPFFPSFLHIYILLFFFNPSPHFSGEIIRCSILNRL